MLKLGYCTSEESVKKSLLYSANKLKNAKRYSTRRIFQKLSSHALVHKSRIVGPGIVSTEGDLRMLFKPQISSIEGQIVARNAMKNDADAFLVKLNGMPVIVRLLRTNLLKASVKDGLMLHQKLSTCPFVHQLFGIGHAKQHGWFAALEFVEKTLWHIIESRSPLLILERARLVSDLAAGLSFLHTAGVYHRNFSPHSVMVSTSLRVKISDFALSEEFAGSGDTLKTLMTKKQSSFSKNARLHHRV